MPFSFFSHTGDIGLTLSGRSLDQLFADAAVALTDTITDHGLVAARQSVQVALRSRAVDLLLVDWLNDLVFRFDTEGLLVAHARVAVEAEGGEWSVHGAVEGERLDPARHPVKVVVKAATYHALEVGRSGDGWHATVVLDV
jgi:SHS2 domain-containing protein